MCQYEIVWACAASEDFTLDSIAGQEEGLRRGSVRRKERTDVTLYEALAVRSFLRGNGAGASVDGFACCVERRTFK